MLCGSEASALDFYVNAAIGSDAYSAVQAQSPATPWATIGRALNTVTSGHTIRVKPGTYAQSLGSKVANVRLRGDGAPGTVIVAPPPGQTGLAIAHRDFVVENIAFHGGTHGVRAQGADGLVIRGCRAAGQTSSGFTAASTFGVVIESSIAATTGTRGIHLDHSGSAYVRNNLVYGAVEWGIDFENADDGDGGVDPPLSTGNVVAFNTVAFSGTGAGGRGGIRLKNATGEVRDNLLHENHDVALRIDLDPLQPLASVHHNLVYGSALPLSPPDYAVGGGMIEAEPQLVDPDGADGIRGTIAGYADDVFTLSQAPLQGSTSPALNAGSGTVGTRDIGGSTRSDGAPDSGAADLGYHAGAPASTGIPPVSTGPATYYVSVANGSDGRSKVTAQNPATPWATIAHALSLAGAGDTIVVAAGTYAESNLKTSMGGVTLRADGATAITPAAGTIGFEIDHPGVIVDGFTFRRDTAPGLAQGVRVEHAAGAVVRRCRIEAPAGNGIWARESDGVVIDSNEITDAGGRGIYVEQSSAAYVRNNLVIASATFGIQVDSGAVGSPPASTDNVVAFNTVVGSGTGGIGFFDATGEIRDNVLAGNATRGVRLDSVPTLVHHNVVFASATAIDGVNGAQPTAWANVSVDPLFVDAAGGNYALSHPDLEAATSPAIDRASGSPVARDISGSTRSNGDPDTGTADAGHHAGAGPSMGVPAMSTPPSTSGTSVLHVDAASGDDARSLLDALDSATPWATIGRALSASGAENGDVVEVAVGTYTEAVQFRKPGITLRGSGQVVVSQPAGAGPVVATDFADTTVENLVLRGGTHAVSADGADRLVVRGCRTSGQTGNGILASESEDVVIDSNRIVAPALQGIVVKRAGGAYVRNNAVSGSGETGIHVDNGDASPPGVTSGNVVAFNTVHATGSASNGGGIRFQKATGEIRDNVVVGSSGAGIRVDTAPSTVHHNAIFGTTSAINTSSGQEPATWGNLLVDPLLVAPLAGSFSLAHAAAGQSADSPAIDQGSGALATVDISGSTRSDLDDDVGTADIGFHAGAAASSGKPPLATPPGSGTGRTIHVDTATGDDARSVHDAVDPARPWKTLERALRIDGATTGDTVLVHAGSYGESVQATTRAPGITIRGQGAATIVVPAGGHGIDVQHANVVIEDLTFQGGANGIRATGANGLVVRRCTITGSSNNGIRVNTSTGVLIDSNRVASTASRGIHLNKVASGYVRNNLVVGTGDVAIQIDNEAEPAPSTGHVIAFNTVSVSGEVALRFSNASGEIRDNIAAGSPSVGIRADREGLVHHNLISGATTPSDLKPGLVAWSNTVADPLFVSAPGGDFRLRHQDLQGAKSPAIDAGSGAPATVDISGSTRTDGAADGGTADVGAHVNATASAGTPPPPAPTPGPTPVPTPVPPGHGPEHYVDCAAGDDSRSRAQAQSPATPWRTIQRGVEATVSGDTVIVKDGVCSEFVEVDRAGIVLRAESPGAVTVAAPSGAAGFLVQANDTTLDGFVVESDTRGVQAELSGAVAEPILRLVLRNLTVRPPSGGAIAFEGIRVRDGEDVRIENSVVRGATGSGIVLRRVLRGYVRNNLAHDNGEWGISLDNAGVPAVSPGNVAAFNTVAGNGNGLRFVNSAGEIRDNVAAFNDNAGIKFDQPALATFPHHNDAFGNAAGKNYDAPSGFALAPSNRQVDPLFVAGSGSTFALSQTAAGQGAQSLLVDTGSGPVASVDISGSTRSDGTADAGVADLGYHATFEPGGPAPTPSAASTTLYVNCASGNDSLTRAEAQVPFRPLLSIAKALKLAVAGDTIAVQPGTCTAGVVIDKAGISLVAEEPLATTIAPASGSSGVRVRADDVLVQGFRIRATGEGVIVAAKNAGQLLSKVRLRGLEIAAPAGQSLAKNGIRAADTDRTRIESCIVHRPDQQGIVLKRSTRAWVRNSLVVESGDFGIHVDNIGGAAASSSNVVAFNTVYRAGRVTPSGGIRIANAVGEVRDNVVVDSMGAGIRADTAGTGVHHNVVFASTAEPVDGEPGVFEWANQTADPLLVDALAGDFSLAQTAAGQASQSPAVDAGSGDVGDVDISGSTRSDGGADEGRADLGYHREAGSLGPVPPVATPTPAPTPTPTPPPPTPTPAPGSGATLYVDPAAGDDARTPLQAQSQATPWRTIGHAMVAAAAGDVITLLNGTYPEAADFHRHSLTLRGAGTLGEVVLRPPANQVGINVSLFENARIENLVVEGGAQGIKGAFAKGIAIRGVAVVGPATVGIQLQQTIGAVVDGNVVTGAGTDAILLRKSPGGYVRNNLVYGNREWGITLDNSGSPLPAASTGNVVAFNTVHANGNGVRMLNASGEVRDNQLTEQVDLALKMAAPDLHVHHNNFSANGRDRDSESEFAGTTFVWASFGRNPRYVQPAGDDGILGGAGWRDDDFRLRQLAGQSPASPMVDAGSGNVAALDIGGSTRTDGVADSGTADVGFHYGAPAATAPPPIAPWPGPFQYTYYVSSATGDDARTSATARNRATPWRTIVHALQQSAAGDTIVVLPGTYAETQQVQIQKPGTTVIAETAGAATVQPPAGSNGITLEASGVTVDGLRIVGAANHGISALAGAGRAAIRNCLVLGTGQNGIRAANLDEVLIEDSVVVGSVKSGILLRKATSATVRNNLVYDSGEWGIALDNSPVGGEIIGVSTGNVVERNTSAFNAQGALRLANATGTVRDNLLALSPGFGLRIDTPGATLLHNGFYSLGEEIAPETYILDSCIACEQNDVRNPRFVNPSGNDGVRGVAGFADDDFRLAQASGGQSPASEVVDAGSADAASLAATGSTSTSGAPDTGTVDLGFHYAASQRAVVAPPPPASGPLPTPTPTPVPTATPTPTPTPTHTATPVPTPTPPPGATPTPTPSPAPTPTPTPTPTPPPEPAATPTASPGPGRTLYVDTVNGSDERTATEAMSPVTPWQTLRHALSQAEPDDVFLVLPGVYAYPTAFQVRVPRVTVRGLGALGDVRIAPAEPAIGIKVVRASQVTLENLWIHGGRRGIMSVGKVQDLVIRDVVVTATAQNAIRISNGDGVLLERATVTGAGEHALLANKTIGIVMRDDLFYGNAKTAMRLVRSEADIAFATIHANGAGIRSVDTALSLRDSIVLENAGAGITVSGVQPVSISYTLLSFNAPDLAPPATPTLASIFGVDPLLVDPDGADGVLGGTRAAPEGWRDDLLLLSQPRGGQSATSPVVDEGSGTAAALGVEGSTAVGGAADILRADLGAHR